MRTEQVSAVRSCAPRYEERYRGVLLGDAITHYLSAIALRCCSSDRKKAALLG